MNQDYQSIALDEDPMPETIKWNDVAAEIHGINVSKGFWPEEKTTRNVGEMLMLVVSEFAEALDAEASGLNDDKLVQYPGVWVEIADAAIRLADGAEAFGADLSDEALAAEAGMNMNLGDYTSLEEDFMLIIRYLSTTMELHRKRNLDWIGLLTHCFGLTIQLFRKYSIPFECIFEKMEYNSKRPFKHGKAY